MNITIMMMMIRDYNDHDNDHPHEQDHHDNDHDDEHRLSKL